ncbi:hypothetical protein K7432_014605 [Basidiobolus ranarum]|uniref:Uncharacterized protein n=1 Tax=Basidiobolus ranarum TaxID=34480 RepID=A0ABR2VQ27_9FUNG
MYTFILDSVTCYELGRNLKENEYPEEQVAINIPDARTFQLSIAKIQNLICVLNERMVKLEEQQTQLPHSNIDRPDQFLSSNPKYILSQNPAEESVALLPQTQERLASQIAHLPNNTPPRAGYSSSTSYVNHRVPETPSSNRKSMSPQLESTQQRRGRDSFADQTAPTRHYKIMRK